MIDGGHNKDFVFCSARWVKHVMNLLTIFDFLPLQRFNLIPVFHSRTLGLSRFRKIIYLYEIASGDRSYGETNSLIVMHFTTKKTIAPMHTMTGVG